MSPPPEFRIDLHGPCPVCGNRPASVVMDTPLLTVGIAGVSRTIPPLSHHLEPCGHAVTPVSHGCSPTYPVTT